MQQRLTYQPGSTHAYETRWTCVATANPFWPLIVKPSMRVPSSTWVEPTKIRLGYWLKWAPTSYPPKLVTSISHLTLLVMFIYMCVWLSLTNRISHATKGTPYIPHATQGTYLTPMPHFTCLSG